MDEKTGKKVLIIGSSAREYTLAQKIAFQKDILEVFVAPGNHSMSEFATAVDIRESNVEELLEFAMENAIDLTIASSELSIKNDIAGVFSAHNLMVFAPSQESASICLNKSVGKRFMYKNRIPCPKFGIFDKSSMAIDYVKNSNMPVVIKTEEHQDKGVLVCSSFSIAKTFIENLFESGEKRVLIEDYVLGHEFSFYVITDGYHALPLGSVATYKSELDGNGGVLTSGMGAFTPDYKVSRQVENRILQQIIYPALNTLARQHTPYVGILGVDLVMNDMEQLFALEFDSFLKTPDSQTILSLLNEDIYSLFQACVIGSFADDYNYIDISEEYATSCVLLCKKKESNNSVIVNGIDNLDEETQTAFFNAKKNEYLEYESTGEKVLVLTRKARVLSRAVQDLYDEISVIDFDGIKYRHDISKV